MKQENLLIITQSLCQGLSHSFSLLILSVTHSARQPTSKSAIQSVSKTTTLSDSNQVLGHRVKQQDNHSVINPVKLARNSASQSASQLILSINQLVSHTVNQKVSHSFSISDNNPLRQFSRYSATEMIKRRINQEINHSSPVSSHCIESVSYTINQQVSYAVSFSNRH
jgi:PP-loop superfamily ATP-utilizing enzyme